MNATLTNLNSQVASMTNNNSNQDIASPPAGTNGQQANSNEKTAKSRVSFLSTLMRVLSSVSF